MTLDELKARAEEAKRRLEEAKAQDEAARREIRDRHERARNEELAAYGLSVREHLAKLSSERFAAQDAYEDARAAAAERGEGLPFPLGTRLFGSSWTYLAGVQALRLDGRVGVLEVFRRGDTERPANVRFGSLECKPGDLVVREILKSGKRGVSCWPFVAGRWVPEGVAPTDERGCP